MLQKKTGLIHLWRALGFAFSGFKLLLQETAFRHELIFLFAVYIIFVFFKIEAIFYIIAFILWLFIIAVEALNTAIELIVDRVSPEFSLFAKNAKDIASFAVFCTIMMHILFDIYVIIRIYI